MLPNFFWWTLPLWAALAVFSAQVIRLHGMGTLSRSEGIVERSFPARFAILFGRFASRHAKLLILNTVATTFFLFLVPFYPFGSGATVSLAAIMSVMLTIWAALFVRRVPVFTGAQVRLYTVAVLSLGLLLALVVSTLTGVDWTPIRLLKLLLVYFAGISFARLVLEALDLTYGGKLSPKRSMVPGKDEAAFSPRLAGDTLSSSNLEPYIAALVSAVALGGAYLNHLDFRYLPLNGLEAVLLPLSLAILKTFGAASFATLSRRVKMRVPELRFLAYAFGGFYLFVAFLLFTLLLPVRWSEWDGHVNSRHHLYMAFLAATMVGFLMRKLGERRIEIGVWGVVRMFSQGLGVRFEHKVAHEAIVRGIPLLLATGALMLAFQAGGLFGISLASMGMISNTGLRLVLHPTRTQSEGFVGSLR